MQINTPSGPNYKVDLYVRQAFSSENGTPSTGDPPARSSGWSCDDTCTTFRTPTPIKVALLLPNYQRHELPLACAAVVLWRGHAHNCRDMSIARVCVKVALILLTWPWGKTFPRQNPQDTNIKRPRRTPLRAANSIQPPTKYATPFSYVATSAVCCGISNLYTAWPHSRIRVGASIATVLFQTSPRRQCAANRGRCTNNYIV